eukprot:176044_1
MATLGKRLKPSHQKSDSEALEDLSAAFHDLDIDGEGLLDQASFQTALRMLGVTLPETELEKIFEVLDEEDTGMIPYDKVKEFMKIGKIPSTILSKIKSTGNSKKRTSVIFGGTSLLNDANGGGGGGGMMLKNRNINKNKNILPILNEKNESSSNQDDKPMDKQRLKMIQRAIIVIKKAGMKTISRKEVIEFLVDKGMNLVDIELAYNKAQEQVMSPDERIKYLQDLSNTRLNEANEQQRINEYLTQEIASHNRETQILRELLKITTDTLMNTAPNKSDDKLTKAAAVELRTKIQQTTKDVKQAEEEKDDRTLKIHRRDLETLQLVSECATKQQHFHSFLYFHQLQDVFRSSMPQLTAFLSNYDAPNTTDYKGR